MYNSVSIRNGVFKLHFYWQLQKADCWENPCLALFHELPLKNRTCVLQLRKFRSCCMKIEGGVDFWCRNSKICVIQTHSDPFRPGQAPKPSFSDSFDNSFGLRDNNGNYISLSRYNVPMLTPFCLIFKYALHLQCSTKSVYVSSDNCQSFLCAASVNAVSSLHVPAGWW